MKVTDKVLYEHMVRIRKIEQAIASEYSQQEMRCPVHLSVGQEAVPVGVSSCLNKTDHVVSAHRSHAHYLAKGGDLKSMLGELYGKDCGCAKGRGGSMHLIDKEVNVTAAVPIVGSSISIGTGIGFGLKKRQSDSIVVVYFGGGATEEGVFAESLDFAALFELPVLFVCENNFYSVYTPTESRQVQGRCLQKICHGHAVKSFFGDGNDVLDVKRKTDDAIDYMRKERQPALLEFNTFRWLEHCGPNWDDDLGYRKDNELGTWMEKCPIDKLKKQILVAEENEEFFERLDFKIQLEISKAFEFVKTSAFPKVEELFDHIYAEGE